MATVTHNFNERQLAYIISSPRGPVAKDLLRRGRRVQAAARRNLAGTTGTGPRRINTGRLRQSISVDLIITLTATPAVRIGTSVYYARWVHDGTGLYGPRHKLITPKRAKALVFRAKYGRRSGRFKGYVVVMSVKGMRPNPFLARALPAFREL